MNVSTALVGSLHSAQTTMPQPKVQGADPDNGRDRLQEIETTKKADIVSISALARSIAQDPDHGRDGI